MLFRSTAGKSGLFLSQASRGTFHLRQKAQSPSHLPIAEGKLLGGREPWAPRGRRAPLKQSPGPRDKALAAAAPSQVALGPHQPSSSSALPSREKEPRGGRLHCLVLPSAWPGGRGVSWACLGPASWAGGVSLPLCDLPGPSYPTTLAPALPRLRLRWGGQKASGGPCHPACGQQ